MNDEIKTTFGERLKYLRVKNNRTQKEIAEYLNITLRAYQYYEVGERFPPIETVIALSKKYDIPFLEVLFDKGSASGFSLTFNNDANSALNQTLSDKANSLGLSTSEIISYILMSHVYN